MSDPVLITPAWQSTKPDDPTRPDLLAPSAWNAARLLTGGNVGDVVTRDASSPTGAIWSPASGRASPILGFDFSSTTTPPPTSSQLRFNAATPAATTALYVRPLTNDGMDAYWVLMNVAPATVITLQDKNDHTLYAQFTTSSAAIDQGSYIEFPVTWKANGGALLNNQGILFYAATATGVSEFRKLAWNTTIIPLAADAAVNAEVPLWTFAITPDLLGSNGLALHVLAWGVMTAFAPPAGSRQIKIYFGAALVARVSHSGGGPVPWLLDGYVLRASSTVQRCIGRGMVTGSDFRADEGAGAENLTAPVSLEVRGSQESTPTGATLEIHGVLLNRE